MKKKILFVTYGGGHVNMIVPVARQLIQQDCCDVKILALTTARKAVEEAGLPCFSMRDVPLSKEANRYGKELLHKIGGSHPDVPYNESLAYMGLSYEALVKEHGEIEAAGLYARKGRQAFLPVSLMKQIISEGNYDLVVATNSPRAEQAAILTAGELGIPALCMVDLFALQEVEWIGKTGYANKVCVLADSVKNMLIDAGRSPDEIVVTGNPAFDRLADPAIKKKAKVLRSKKGWGNKKVILWCSQPEPEVHPFTGKKGNPNLPLTIEKELQKICNKYEAWHLFVRPHPSENLDTRMQLKGVEYGQVEDLYELLYAVDLVVVMSTTVGLEAALIGKPVVALNMSIFSPDMPYADMGIAYGVDCLEELSDTLQEALKKRALSTGLPPVGHAAHAVCEVITGMLEEADG